MAFEGCNFFSCDQMWRGISVEHQFTVLGLNVPSFRFEFCNIEDATSALWFKNPSLGVSFEISENTFNNNYIGLSAFKDLANGAPQWMALGMRGNQIGTNQNLRPFYSLKVPPLWPLAYTGVSIKKLTTFIGEPATTNSFFRMANGIVCENSVLTSVHNEFNTLWTNGIMARSSNLTVTRENSFIGNTGLLPTGQAPPIMQNGVFATATDLDIVGSYFRERLMHGIYSENNLNAEQIDIHGNYFEQTQSDSKFGVLMERSAASASGQIPAHNQIYGNHCNCQLPDRLQNYTCFWVAGTNSATDNMDIFENRDINLTLWPSSNMGNAIAVEAQNGDNYRIIDNEVHLNGDAHSNNFYGINFSGVNSENNHIDLNNISGIQTIAGDPPYTIQCAIHVGPANSEVSLCENTVDKATHGLHFHTDSDYPVIAENRIHDHEFGLRIESSVQFGYHDGSGNQWLGTYSVWAAQKYGTLSPSPTDPITVRFWVPESDMLPFLPPSNLLSPNPDNEPVTARKWFRHDPAIPIDYCTPETPLMGLSPSESKVADGTSPSGGARLWDARRHLYRKLLEQPELAPAGSVSAAFKASFQNTSVANFAQFDAQYRSATRFPANEQNAHDNLILGIVQNQAQSENLLASINYDLSLASPEVKEQVQTLYEQVSTDFGSLLGAKKSQLLQVDAALNNAGSYNNSLAAVNAQEQARKTLNAIHVSLSMGNPLTELQYQNLLGIAAQNEDAVGSAKSEAVRLLSPCEQGAYLAEMHEHEGEARSSNPSNLAGKDLYRVFPNPGSGWFNVTAPKGTNGLLRITDLSGRTVQILLLDSGQNDLAVNLSAYPIGLYGFSFFDASGKLSQTIKVSVHR